MDLGPVVSRACVTVHGVLWAEELTERRYAYRLDNAGLEVEEQRAENVLTALGLAVKHVDAAELRVVVAAVLAVAAVLGGQL